MKNHAARFALLSLLALILVVPAFADSQARIVRLSSVEGSVEIDRNLGHGFEKAFLNLPITEGAKLRTNADARAEVEFEDGSTLRLTPATVVAFPELSLRDSGEKNSAVKIQEGTAYVNFTGAKNNQMKLEFGRESVLLTSPAHLRVGLGDTDATLAVFKGTVQAEGPSGRVEIGKKKSVTFNLLDGDKYAMNDEVEQDPYDAWDKQQQAYTQRYSSSSYSSYSPYAYGTSDLSYYGSFSDVPGYGMMWQPYFAGAGWDPFMSGTWVYYPGFGYSWVSAYPWGWTPYHYGSWVYVPSYGWGWQPGGSWAGWNTQPHVINPPHAFVPPKAPSSPGTTVVVNRGPSFPTSKGHWPSKVTVREGSAGLGIPRGSVSNLGKLSERVNQQGAVTTSIHKPAPATPVQTLSSPGISSPSPSRTGGFGTPSPSPRPAPRPAPSPRPPHR